MVNLFTDGPHDFAGRRFVQNPDFGFRIDVKRYIDEKLSPIGISAARKSLKTEPCTESESRQLRTVNGAPGWVARQIRPDECSTVSLLQSAWSRATVQDVLDANASIRRLKGSADVGIRVVLMPITEIRTMSFSDAGNGGADSPDHHSHGGFIVGLTAGDLNRNVEAPVSIISWSSHKIKRKVDSTLHGESLCLADGLAEAEWVWCLFREAVFADFKPSTGKRANDADVSIPTVIVLKDESQVIVDPAIVSVVDAKAIFDRLVRECTGGQCRIGPLSFCPSFGKV